MPRPSLFLIKAMLILSADGKRIVGKYYDNEFDSPQSKKAFEKSLFAKTAKANGEILLINNLTVVYRAINDLNFYVVSSTEENELMLISILNCLFDTVALILRKNVERKFLLDNLDLVFLAMDEMCDDGILMEVDPSQIYQRVSIREPEMSATEQKMMDAFKSAKSQLKATFK